MKQYWVLLGIICCTFAFTSCESGKDESTDLLPAGVPFEELNDEQKFEYIRRDYFEDIVKIENPLATLADVEIFGFYGSYNCAYVFQFSVNQNASSGWGAMTYYTIGDFDMSFPSWLPPIVWFEEDFYEFEESYYLGLLTMDDLVAISNVNIDK